MPPEQVVPAIPCAAAAAGSAGVGKALGSPWVGSSPAVGAVSGSGAVAVGSVAERFRWAAGGTVIED